MYSNFIRLFCVIVFLSALPCSSLAKEPRSIDWFHDLENKAALEEKLRECKSKSESEQKADEECYNAKQADIYGEKFQKVKEPTFGF